MLLLAGFQEVREARDGPPVVEIEITGNRRVTDRQISAFMRTKVGEPLDPRLIAEDIRDIYQRHGARVTALEEAMEGGLRLTLQVYEEVLITRIETTGVSAARGKELQDGLSLGGVRALLESQVEDRAGELQRKLRREGHYFAEVNLGIEVRDGAVVGTLEIHEGPKVEVDSIEFVGLRTLEEDHLRAAMVTDTSLFFVLESYLSQEVLERDIVELQTYVQRQGLLDGKVSLEGLEFNAAQDEVGIQLRVQEGRLYTAGKIRIEGNSDLSSEELAAEIELDEGDALREATLEKDRKRMLMLYGERGYVRAEVRTEFTFSEQDQQVEVRYVIDEGPMKRIRDVVIHGNARTKNTVVRRRSTLDPGDLASTVELRRTADRLRALHYFVDNRGQDRVQVRFQQTSDPTLEDLFIDVDDGADSSWWSIGAGASFDTGFWAAVQLRKNNFDLTDLPSSWNPVTFFGEAMRAEAFHGGGQQLTLSAIPGNKVSSFLLSFTEPSLVDADRYPYSLEVEAFQRSVRLVDDVDEDRLGLTTTLGKQLDDHWSTGIIGRLELVDIEGDSPDEVEDVEGSNFVPSIGVFGRYEQVDSITDPKDGYRFGASYDLLGADAAGQRVIVDGELFVPVMEDSSGRRQILSLKGAVGAAQSFGGDLPFFERFQGGGTTGPFGIRGFEYRGVGPEADGVFLGGELAWAASGEYRFPVVSTYDVMLDEDVETLRGVVFVDAGSLESSFGELLSATRLSLGAGVRFKLPFLGNAPVALDLGIPVLTGSDDETEYFSIRVSTRF